MVAGLRAPASFHEYFSVLSAPATRRREKPGRDSILHCFDNFERLVERNSWKGHEGDIKLPFICGKEDGARFQHAYKPLRQSLTVLPKELETQARKFFRLILKLEKSTQKKISRIRSLMMTAISKARGADIRLVDEFFLQLAKQINGTPSTTSQGMLWSLMLALLQVESPSHSLLVRLAAFVEKADGLAYKEKISMCAAEIQDHLTGANSKVTEGRLVQCFLAELRTCVVRCNESDTLKHLLEKIRAKFGFTSSWQICFGNGARDGSSEYDEKHPLPDTSAHFLKDHESTWWYLQGPVINAIQRLNWGSEAESQLVLWDTVKEYAKCEVRQDDQDMVVEIGAKLLFCNGGHRSLEILARGGDAAHNMMDTVIPRSVYKFASHCEVVGRIVSIFVNMLGKADLGTEEIDRNLLEDLVILMQSVPGFGRRRFPLTSCDRIDLDENDLESMVENPSGTVVALLPEAQLTESDTTKYILDIERNCIRLTDANQSIEQFEVKFPMVVQATGEEMKNNFQKLAVGEISQVFASSYSFWFVVPTKVGMTLFRARSRFSKDIFSLLMSELAPDSTESKLSCPRLIQNRGD